MIDGTTENAGPENDGLIRNLTKYMSVFSYSSFSLMTFNVVVNECLAFQPEAGHYEVNGAAGTLRIVNVARSDKGNYACVVNTTGHSVVVSGNAHLYVESTISSLLTAAYTLVNIILIRLPYPPLKFGG